MNDNEIESTQPPREIPGGPRRTSARVERQLFPAIEARERVAALLRTHDFAEAERALAQLTEADDPFVRLIAQEGAFSGAEPAVRYKAIAALGRRPSA